MIGLSRDRRKFPQPGAEGPKTDRRERRFEEYVQAAADEVVAAGRSRLFTGDSATELILRSFRSCEYSSVAPVIICFVLS
jgi:hypothetical protein